MLHLGLSAGEQKKLLAALATSHSIRVGVDVMSMNGEVLQAVDQRLIDGQVDVDADAEVTRSCSLTLLDPDGRLQWAPDSPDDGAMYLDRMIRVTYGVKVETVGWVDIPVFTGPISKADRNDDEVSVEAQGKERLALGMAWRPITFKKGHRKTGAIRSMLAERAGEDRFDLPDLNTRLSRTVSLSRESIPWKEAKLIAASMNRQLFYDGRGICRLRSRPGHQLTFRDGTGGLVMTPPQIAYDLERVRNTIWVKGGQPKGVKTDDDPDTPAPKSVPDVRYHLSAKASHPLSPARLGRNGTPRHLVEIIENSRIRSVAEARNVAHDRLADLLMESVQVTFEALPVPMLEPFDAIRVSTVDGTFQMRLHQFSLPLTAAGENMTVGFLRRVSARRRRRNRK